MLSCQNYSEVISNFYNERMNDYDWNVAFKFLDLFKAFYESILACFTDYKPTSCKVLIHLYNVSYAFKTFEQNIMFKNICDAMEENFQKYSKDIPHLFICVVVLDPTIKEVGAKLLVKDIIENFLRGVDTNFDTIMSPMNELFNFIKKKLDQAIQILMFNKHRLFI